MEKKRDRTRIYITLLIVLAVIVVIVAGILIFFFTYSKSCSDRSCFESAMARCSRAGFIDENPETVWQYSITGKSGGLCNINVQLLQIKKGTSDLEKLNGLDMDCSLPIGYVANPQDDLTKCHGILKESLQEMMINKMHVYILENIGRISEELTKAV